MNFKDVIKVLKSPRPGCKKFKRLAKSYWLKSDGNDIYFVEDDSDSYRFSLDDIFAEDWEITDIND